MKTPSALMPVVIFLTFVLVVSLGIIGAPLAHWLYALLAVVCLAVVAFLWSFHRKAEKRNTATKRDDGRRSNGADF